MAKTKDKKYKTYIIWRGRGNQDAKLIDIFWCPFDANLPCINPPDPAGDYWMLVRAYYGAVLNVNNWEDMLITGANNAHDDLRAHGIIP